MATNYDARMRRAKNLKETYPFAAEILTFYGRICAMQQRLSQELAKPLRREARSPEPGSLREHLDVDVMLPFVKNALSELLPHSPGPLAEFMKEYLCGSQERWAASLQRYVTQGGTDEESGDSREELVARILIDPYAELLAAKQTPSQIWPAGMPRLLS